MGDWRGGFNLDATLDRFEARVRRKWAGPERRLRREYLRRMSATEHDGEIALRGGAKPSLDYYDNLGAHDDD